MREYSHGFHSHVYHTEPEQQQDFPNADLFKQIDSNDPNWFLRWYLRYRIASLLFPSNIIEVVGAQSMPSNESSWPRQLPVRKHLLYSRLAPVGNGHAIFSKHMDLFEGSKTSMCECEACTHHRKIHERRQLAVRAKAIGKRSRRLGFELPVNDPSDYCLRRDGKIVFFEMEKFSPATLDAFLREAQPGSTRDLCQTYLADHQQLYRESRKLFQRGLCNLVLDP